MTYLYNIETAGTSNATFQISDNTFDTTNTSLTLPGRNKEVYGQPIIQNWVDMVQHFAGSNTQFGPRSPLPGQIWYDIAKQELKIYTSKPLLGGGIQTKWENLIFNNASNVSFGSFSTRDITISGNASIGGNVTVVGTTNLGLVGNVKIGGGANGQVLTTDGGGNLRWGAVQSGGSGATGGIGPQGPTGPAGPAGAQGADGKAIYAATVFTTQTNPTRPSTGTGTFDFATNALTPPIGWTVTPPTSSTTVYASRHPFVYDPSISTNKLVTAGEWSEPFLAYAQGANGAPGTAGLSATSSYNMSAYIRSTGPGRPLQGTGQYNFTTGVPTAPIGNPTGQVWSTTPPTVGSDPLWVSYATATVVGGSGVNTNTLVWSEPVQLAQTGSAGAAGRSVFNYTVYRDSANTPTTPSGGQYNFGSASGIPPAGWSNVPSGARIWVSVASAYADGSSGTWVAGIGAWSAPVEFSGVAGQNSAVGYLTNESVTVAADVDGVIAPGALTAAGGQFKVFDGLTDVTTQCTFAVAGSTGLTITISATGAYTITAVTQDTASATLRANYQGVAIEKIYVITKSKTGATGGNGADAKLITMTTTAQAFTYDSTGSPSPVSQTISFTANLQNLTGTPVWTCTLYNSSNSQIGSVSLGAGLTTTLNVTSFGSAKYAVVSVSLGTLTDITTIVRLTDGLSGNSGNDGWNIYTALVYIPGQFGAVPATPVGGKYNFNSNLLTPPQNWSRDIPTSVYPNATFVSTYTFKTRTPLVDVNVPNPPDANNPGWSTPQQVFSSGTNGADGLPARSSYNYTVYTVAAPAATVNAPVGGSWNFTGGVGSPPTGNPPSQVWTTAPPTISNPLTQQLYFSTTTATVIGNEGPNSNNPLVWSPPSQLSQVGATGPQGELGPPGPSGLSLYNFAVYLTSPTVPVRPVGGSYNFGAPPASAATPPSGWSLQPGEGTVWISVTTASSPTLTGTWNGDSNSWTTPVRYTGAGNIVGFLTNESVTIATGSDGVATSTALSVSGGVFNVFSGTTDVTTGKGTVYSVESATSGLSITINASTGAYIVTAMSPLLDTATAKLVATYSGITVKKDYVISKSKSGTNGADAKLIVLTSDAYGFKFNGNNAETPPNQVITITAKLQNINANTNAVSFAYTKYDSFRATVGTGFLVPNIQPNGDVTATMTTANVGFTASVVYIKVIASVAGLNLSDSTSIVRLQDGLNGTNGTNGTDGTNGINGTPGQSKVIAVAYGTPDDNATTPNAPQGGSFNFTTNVLTAPTRVSGTAITWYKELLPSWGGRRIYTSQAAFSTTDPAATNVPPSTSWSPPILTFSPGVNGVDGQRGFIPLGFAVVTSDPIVASDSQLTAWFQASRTNPVAPIGLGTSPITGDTVQFYWDNPIVGGQDKSIIKRYTGSAWETAPGVIVGGDLIATGSITASQMNTNSLYTLDMKSTNATALEDFNSPGYWMNSRTGNARFAGNVSIGGNVTIGSVITSPGNNPTLANGSVGTNQVVGGSISADKLTTNFVLTKDIQGGSSTVGTPSGTGYWMRGSDGSAYFGGNTTVRGNIIGGTATVGQNSGTGFWLASNGSAYFGGDTKFAGAIDAGSITTGTLNVARIPTITSDKINATELSAINSKVGFLTIDGAGNAGALSMGNADWADPSSTGGPGMSGSGFRFQKNSDGGFWFTMGSSSTNIAYSSWYNRLYLNGDVVATSNIRTNNVTATGKIDDYPTAVYPGGVDYYGNPLPDSRDQWPLPSNGQNRYYSNWLVMDNTVTPQKILVNCHVIAGNRDTQPSNLFISMQHSPDGSNWYQFYQTGHSITTGLTTGHTFVADYQPGYSGTTRVRFEFWNQGSSRTTYLQRVFAYSLSTMR